MSGVKKFTECQRMDMRDAYEKGLVLADISKAYKCSMMTVASSIRDVGGKIRPKSVGQRSRSPIVEIMADWNRGMKATDICDKYGLFDNKSLYDKICRWRTAGYPFIPNRNSNESPLKTKKGG